MSKEKKDDEGSSIQTFLRIRPSKKPSGYIEINPVEERSLSFSLPHGFKSDYINNTKLKHDFHFNGVIGMDAKQDQVFQKVGVAAVKNALDGFNSTIFAYGQTGSGKTFTITGGPERYADRGIIPRAVSMIYGEFRKRTDVQFKAFISYLELYNEKGYDLLDPSHESKALEDLPKVSILEDEHGSFHLKNLSMNAADTEEDALNLLFMGDTNRAIAETPMNMASSRSHCIFTISMEVRGNGSDRIRRSKLHLVDLAGSERIGKTQSAGSVLTEAKHINSSLFFLEMVIVALHEKATNGRAHIPYRNSMMTSVLRDSLGGNCKTIMIATINPETDHTDESLSTCRFAQRVSLIKNRATVNEDMDPSMVIRRLKSEILALREEIAFLKGEAGEGDILTPSDLEVLKNQVKSYVDDPDPRALLNVGSITLTKMKDAFAIMKNFSLEARAMAKAGGGGAGPISPKPEATAESKDLARQIKDLKSCLLQRDNEIAILVNMVKKGKTQDHIQGAVLSSRDGSRGAGGASPADGSIRMASGGHYDRLGGGGGSAGEEKSSGGDSQSVSMSSTTTTSNPVQRAKSLEQQERERQREREEKIIQRHLFGVAPPEDPTENAAIMDDPGKAFEFFREKSSLSPAIEENKEILRDKYAEAKSLGERANSSRSTISYLKNSIESLRRERALQGMSGDGKEGDGGDAGTPESEQEASHRRAIEQEKVIYKESFEKLRVLKPEIEHIRKILEKGRANLQSQFDQWYNSLLKRDGVVSSKSAAANASMSSYVRTGGQGSVSSATASGNTTALDISMGDASSVVASSKDRLAWGTPPSHGRRSEEKPVSASADAKEDVNEDILAFYQAKDELLKKRQGGR